MPRSTITVLESRDGLPLTVRAIEPSDKAQLVHHFEHLSEVSRARRFLAPIRHLTERDLAYYTELDHRQHEALIAVTAEGELVGVARYIRLPDRPAVAEVAEAVVDDWQGRGVGTGLLRLLAERAWNAGVRSFLGVCMVDNPEMQRLLRKLGPECRTTFQGDGTVELEVELPRN
jgi:RimJ/RimL family protein N-acetyltransferase